MAGRLEKLGVLSTVDDAVLWQYAQLWGEVEESKRECQRLRRLSLKLQKSIARLMGADQTAAIQAIANLEGLTVKQSVGVRAGRMALRQYLVEFGSTPVARQRLKIAPGAQKPGKLAAFMGGKQA